MHLLSKDVLVIIAGILIMGMAGGFFYYERTRKLEVQADDPVGVIHFRYRVAERRFRERVIWRGVDQGDPVYNRDYIRTDNLSEAIITLDDGTVIELDPESMIVLDLRSQEPGIEFLQGSILINRTDSRSLEIRTEQSGLTMQNGRARINTDGNELEISARQGKIELDRPFESVEEGESLLISGNETQRFQTAPALLQPEDNKRFFTNNPEMEISFSWEEEPCREESFLDIALDRSFAEIEITARIEGFQKSVILTENIFFWRIRCDGHTSDVRKFRIIRNPVINLYTPANESVLPVTEELENGEIFVNFSWEPLRLSSSYRIQVSKHPDMTDLIQDRVVRRDNISFKLEAGSYFWQIEATGAIPGANSKSNIHRFTLLSASDFDEYRKEIEEKLSEIPEPEPLTPGSGSVLDMSVRDSILFRWKEVEQARNYRVTLFLPSGQVADRFVTAQNAYRYRNISALDVGRFRWTIEAISDTGETLSQATGSFRIVLSEQPDAPELLID